MEDNIETKKKKFTEDLMAALAYVECIKDHLCSLGKDSTGDMIYQIRGDLLAPPGRLLNDIEMVLNDALKYLYAPGDPIVERLKAVKELRGSLDGLKSATEGGVEFYEAGDKNGN